jgi:integrase/recombinase XerD
MVRGGNISYKRTVTLGFSMQLFDDTGQRLYLTESERYAFLAAADQDLREVRTLCLTLAYTGCRVSEALSLTHRSIDFGSKAIVIETLKKRKRGIFRAVPVPDSVLDILNTAHGIKDAQRARKVPTDTLLWDWCRKTAWQKVSQVSPKGLRHGFGVLAISKGVPLNMVSKWMEHASLEVTAIYANALGEEQRHIASRMWS